MCSKKTTAMTSSHDEGPRAWSQFSMSQFTFCLGMSLWSTVLQHYYMCVTHCCKTPTVKCSCRVKQWDWSSSALQYNDIRQYWRSHYRVGQCVWLAEGRICCLITSSSAAVGHVFCSLSRQRSTEAARLQFISCAQAIFVLFVYLHISVSSCGFLCHMIKLDLFLQH